MVQPDCPEPAEAPAPCRVSPQKHSELYSVPAKRKPFERQKLAHCCGELVELLYEMEDRVRSPLST